MINVDLIPLDILSQLVPRSAISTVYGTLARPVVHRSMPRPTSVKDLIESVGIPHCEVGSIVATSGPRPGRRFLSDQVVDGDVLEIRPQQPFILDEVSFICDQHLGRLARLLRLLGFDTTWARHWLEPELARRAVNENRVPLSGSRALLKRKTLEVALLVRSDRPDRQAVEVLTRFRLAGQVRLFGRCSRCNGVITEVAKTKVESRIPPRTARWLDRYYICPDCDHLYWEGTHVSALKTRLEAILTGAQDHRTENRSP